MAIIISYPTSASGIIVFITPTKYKNLNKINMPLKISRALTISVEHGAIMAFIT